MPGQVSAQVAVPALVQARGLPSAEAAGSMLVPVLDRAVGQARVQASERLWAVIRAQPQAPASGPAAVLASVQASVRRWVEATALTLGLAPPLAAAVALMPGYPHR